MNTPPRHPGSTNELLEPTSISSSTRHPPRVWISGWDHTTYQLNPTERIQVMVTDFDPKRSEAFLVMSVYEHNQILASRVAEARWEERVLAWTLMGEIADSCGLPEGIKALIARNLNEAKAERAKREEP